MSFRVRYRMDGDLYEIVNLPLKYRSPVISRVKILSNMDIAEKRLPQDGRIKMRLRLDNGKKKEVDMRVSSLPTLWGEKIVARILDKEMLKLDLTQLGFEEESLAGFEEAIHKPWGIVLVTGPTGSGKTNTLYSAISTINSPDMNIMTAEDPVEFNVPNINQVQVKEEIGLTFAACLRTFLRQDPDIMLVGEMRDQETVDIAIKAALTGHLVFSTIHTNDAASSITRMVNMNVEPFLIADSLILVVAQRLIRRLCKKCAQPHALPEAALLEMGYPEERAQGPPGHEARRLRLLQQDRLQGPDGPLRGHEDRRRHPDDDPDPGPVPGDQEEGHREGHADPAPERPRQDQERRHLGRGSPARDRPGRTDPERHQERRIPWPSRSSSC